MLFKSIISKAKFILSKNKLFYESNNLIFNRFYTSNSVNSPLPKTKQISTPQFKSILTEDLIQLSNVFKKYNYELKIAGGAVRDLLLDIVPHDIDLVSDATPPQMLEIFEKEQIRIFNLNGLKHGTVSVRMNDRTNYEITTLRVDVVTDGRRAQVKFVKEWHLDSNRRDFTVNSMFLDLNGTIVDYFNGIEDLKNRTIRFVGDPQIRIQEDYLRILRYFRFFGRISLTDQTLLEDKQTYNAIKNNSSGLKIVSGERIWEELKKIVVQTYADKIIKSFYELGLAPYMGFPKEPNFDQFDKIYKQTRSLNPKPITLIVSLMNNIDDFESFDNRIKMSNEDKYLAIVILNFKDKLTPILEHDPLMYYKQAIAKRMLNIDPLFHKTEVLELLKYQGNSKYLNEINDFVVPVYPLKDEQATIFKMLPETLKLNPNQLKRIQKQLKILWIESNFAKTKNDLLNNLKDDRFLNQFELKNMKREKNEQLEMIKSMKRTKK